MFKHHPTLFFPCATISHSRVIYYRTPPQNTNTPAQEEGKQQEESSDGCFCKWRVASSSGNSVDEGVHGGSLALFHNAGMRSLSHHMESLSRKFTLDKELRERVCRCTTSTSLHSTFVFIQRRLPIWEKVEGRWKAAKSRCVDRGKLRQHRFFTNARYW